MPQIIDYIKVFKNRVIDGKTVYPIFSQTTSEWNIKTVCVSSSYREIEKGWFDMGNLLSYKNYNGTVEYSREDSCLFGKVIGIKSLLSFEGDSVQELEQDFRNVIDEYLKDCEERNIQPEQPYKGTFNVQISH